VIFGVLVLTALALFVFLLAGPRRQKLRDLRTAVAELQTAIAERGQLGGVARACATEIRQLSEEHLSQGRHIPETLRLGPFLEELADALGEAGIGGAEVEPGEAWTSGGFGVCPIELSYQGTFSATFELLRRLETLDRRVFVQSLEMGRGEPGEPSLQTVLTLEVYFEPAS
jgi:hypothetical protein